MSKFIAFVSIALGLLAGTFVARAAGNWLWVFVGIPVAAFIYSSYDEARSKRERREREEAEEKHRKEYQALLVAAFERNTNDVRQQLSALSTLASQATSANQVARREFSERAFAPFWDQVEAVLTILAKYDQELGTLRRRASDLDGVAEKLGRASPSKQELASLPAVFQPTTELRAIIREAQRDFQFAQIYETRRTNKILIQGFETLASAIDGLGTRIENAIQSLKNTEKT